MTMGHSNGVNGKTASRRFFIACRIEPGMFSGEYLVTFDAVDPSDPEKKIPVQLLADEKEVTGLSGSPKRGNPVTGMLRVEMVDQAKGFALVALPQPAQPVGERAYVDDDDVVQEKVRI
jgi:hypothetical protein